MLSLKKFIAISSLAVATLGTYYGYKTISEIDLPEVLEYVQEHPENNEEVVNHAIKCKIKHNIPYSGSTLRAFSEVVLYQAIQNQFSSREKTDAPKKNNPPSILENLTPEEKWGLIQEGFLYRSKKFVEDTSEIGFDLYDKMKETKLYESFGGKKSEDGRE